MIAYLFIGQGVELPWVADDVLADPDVIALVTIASEATGCDIARLLVRGGRELSRSEILQPAMVAVCLGVERMLARAGVAPAIVLGHSLGEITAWAASGAITAEDAVTVAVIRGRLMAREAARHPGGMLRLTGDRETCERAIALGRQLGSICIGAHNGVDEWGLAGDEAALAHVLPQFRTLRLPVAGAWHSPAMAGALDEMTAAITALPRRPMTVRMISNRDGRFAADADLPALLAGQLVHPVQWVASLETLVAAGVRRYVAVGPGKMLRSLVHRNLGVEQHVDIIDSARAVRDFAAACV
ncbi:MAG: fabD2 [Myxococcales bacterium]|nr:fabD2 [Myxococcales bacterium]